MVKQELKVLEGYEEIYDKLVAMRSGIEEKIRKQVEEEAKHIDNMLAEITEFVEVEVPDEVAEDQVEPTETQTY
jgi:hypothetical protein